MPPIEVNFPAGNSDSWFRLCSVRASTDLTQANIILTFEDAIVSELREHEGPEVSGSNETRAEFMRRLVKQASQHKLLPGDTGIRFIALLPSSVFTVTDLNADQVTLPASAKLPGGRPNPNKTAGPPSLTASAPTAPSGTDMLITDGLTSLESSVTSALNPAYGPPVGPGG